MKRIVIACDGTWNRLDALRPTNVGKLAQAVLPRDENGTAQIVLHLDGVGTGAGTVAITRRIDQVVGGAFGIGVSERIALAYRFLVLNYEPGDEIYIFGYSRGAYTARSLGGMIRRCGILERNNAGEVDEAMALYRRTDIDADSDAAKDFRATWSSHVTTGADELAWRRGRKLPDRIPAPVPLGVRFIGVWDTVGALGIPQGLSLAGRLNRPYQFHDTKLSKSVHAARHAIAIDERRSTFPATTWENLADFAATGRHLEQWFPGNHGSVGGGGEVSGLSDGALVWVLEGAIEAGLALDETKLTAWRAGADFGAALTTNRPGLAGRLLRLRMVDRDGPGSFTGVAASARSRWHADASYRPKALGRLVADLDAWAPEAPPAQAPAAASIGR